MTVVSDQCFDGRTLHFGRKNCAGQVEIPPLLLFWQQDIQRSPSTLSGDPACRLEMSLHFVEILARAESGSELFMKEDLLRRDLVGVFEERKNCS